MKLINDIKRNASILIVKFKSINIFHSLRKSNGNRMKKHVSGAIKKSKSESFKKNFNLSLRNLGSSKSFNSIDNLLLKIFIVLSAAMFIFSLFFIGQFTIGWFLLFITIMTIIVPLILYILTFYVIRMFAQYVMYKRKKELEYYLPEMLQLTAANMNAGMMLERALFNAVKPHFGVLRDEMELVAKDTMAGKGIDEALRTFADKYSESGILDRTVNIILEGMRSGSRMGDLLNKISINIQELRIMKKEMSASVMSYVIFITVASIAAAPVLMGLSHELLVVVKQIMSTISLDASSSTMSFSLSFDTEAISLMDFKIFTFTNIFFTSLFSALIVSAITKGNLKESIKVIPIYIAIASVIYIISFKLLSVLMGNFF